MSKHHADVTEADFDVEVIERSHELPVLVDFWAPWCGPCQFLGPTLDKMVEEFGGAFALAKVDTDQCPGISRKYGVQGIPDVKLFHRGVVIDGFVGALPAPEVRRFLRRALPSEADDAVAAGEAALAEGDRARARAELERALALDDRHVGARLASARLALAEGDAEAIVRHVDMVDPGDDRHELAEHLRAAADFVALCVEAGGEALVRAAAEAAPEDLEAQYRLGCCLAAAGELRGAMEAFMSVIRATGKRFRDGAAHRAMLTLFGLAGRHSDLSDEFKRQLQIYI